MVTVTYNSAAVLPEFLGSLSIQSNKDWELVVVDNNSHDATRAMVRAWDGPLHRLLANDDNRGFAAGMNQGIEIAREAGFDSVLMINNDTLFGPSFLDELLNNVHRGQAEILAPVVRYANAPERIWFGGGRFTWLRGALQAEMLEQVPLSLDAWKADFAPGCCLLMEMSVFEKVGLLDESFFVYWEDVDYCWRCRIKNIGILVLRSPSILHQVSSLTGGNLSDFTIRMWHRNQIIFLRKHFGPLFTAAQFPLMLGKIIARYIARRDKLSQMRLRLSVTWESLLHRHPKTEDRP